MNEETKTCTKCVQPFTIDENDRSFYQKMKVPVPTVCPDCRFKMRAIWRNETRLYTGRMCGLCQKSIVTMYNPKLPYVVYCTACYRGDSWDPKSYGMEYDYSKPFFEQLKELILRVPKSMLYSPSGNGVSTNSEFTNCVGGLKNCYFCFNCSTLEDSMYSRGITYSTETLDSYFGIKLDRCYETVNTQNSSGVTHAKNTISSVDCHFMTNCSGCTNCFGCVNLRNKSYCFFNEQLSKESYQEKMGEILGSHARIEEMRQKFYEFEKTFPVRENNNIKVLDSVGDYLSESKNVQYSFEIIKGEDSKWNFSSREFKDCYGTLGYAIKSELLCEVTSTGFASRAIGTWACELSQEIEYSVSCFPNNKNIMGCDSLRNAQYCILNKQYSKEEYEKIRDHIVAELTEKGLYGLMIPPELAPFAYNETIAQDNMPLSREEAIAQGFRWEDDIQMTKGKETIEPEQIPDHIRDVSEDVTKEVLRCVACERNYRITPQELLFYRKMTLPIPRACFYCRHTDRIRRRGPYQFWDRECAHCNKAIKTTYSPERPEIVYCESCYQQEVM